MNRLSSIAGLTLALALAACGGDDATPLYVSIHGPDGNLPFPESVDSQVATVRLFSVRGLRVNDVVEAPYINRGIDLPALTYGDNYWIGVEGLDGSGNVLASGATASFRYDEGVDLSAITAMTLLPRRISAGFTPTSGGSVPAQLLGEPVAGHTMTELADNQGYLIAGGVQMGPRSAGSTGVSLLGATDALHFYDPYTGIFTPVCDADAVSSGICQADTCFQNSECLIHLSEPRGFHAAARLNDGSVAVIGGLTVVSGQGIATNAVDVITPSGDGLTARIRTLDPASQALIDARAFPTATRMSDGQIVVVGGMSGSLAAPTFPTRVEVGQADGQIFRAATENDLEIAVAPRAMHTATRVGRRILLVGGRTADAVVGQSELLVLDNGRILNDPPPTVGPQVARFGHAASTVELPNDGEAFDGVEVAISGGYTQVGSSNLFDGSAATGSTEFYLGNSYLFYESFTANLATPRAFHTQSMLPVLGEAFVYGGVDESGAPIASAQAGERLTLYPGQPPVYETLPSDTLDGRAFGTQVTLGSQFVMMVGGWNGNASTATTSVYNSNDYEFLHSQF